MPGYASIENKKAELIRKAIQGSVFIAPYTAPAISTSTLFGTTGDLATLPTGYNDLGWTDETGAVFDRKVTTTGIAGWGTLDPLRTDVTADTTTLKVNAYQTDLVTVGLFANVLPSAISAGVNGVVALAVPTAPITNYYRVLAVGIDETANGEVVFARYFPNAQVTEYGAQSYSDGKDPLAYGVTFTANLDGPSGFAQQMIYGGAGWLYMLSDAGIPRIVSCTVALTTALVATTGTFSSYDVGATVSGLGLVSAQTIVSVGSSTTATLSAAGTVAGSAVAVTITPVSQV
jgi:hypothetical protein